MPGLCFTHTLTLPPVPCFLCLPLGAQAGDPDWQSYLLRMGQSAAAVAAHLYVCMCGAMETLVTAGTNSEAQVGPAGYTRYSPQPASRPAASHRDNTSTTRHKQTSLLLLHMLEAPAHAFLAASFHCFASCLLV